MITAGLPWLGAESNHHPGFLPAVLYSGKPAGFPKKKAGRIDPAFAGEAEASLKFALTHFAANVIGHGCSHFLGIRLRGYIGE